MAVRNGHRPLLSMSVRVTVGRRTRHNDSVPEFIEFEFADGSSVLLHTFPVAAAESQGQHGLPPGLGGAVPVGRAADRLTPLAHEALRTALRPLVPLLQEVHDTVTAVPDRPQEIAVQFGVRFGSDLKLAVVGGSAEASLTVSATWKLPDRAPVPLVPGPVLSAP
jgi:hypothetical protein